MRNLPRAEPAFDATVLHAKIGELTLANDFGLCAREGRFVAGRKAMIDPGPLLPLAAQADAGAPLRAWAKRSANPDHVATSTSRSVIRTRGNIA